MEINDKTNADYMLTNALRRSEMPSPELLRRIRFNAVSEGPVLRIYPRPRRLAIVAALVVMLLTISTVALAYTGVLSDVISTIINGTAINGGIGSSSRKAIVEQGYVASVTSDKPAIAEGNSLELIAYYADAKEIGFNFILTSSEPFDEMTDAELSDKLAGAEPSEFWENIYFNYFCLEMTGSDGVTNTWEQIVDLENGFERRTFPGGYSYYDWKNEIYEYEPDDGKDPMESIAVADVQDFQHYAVAQRVDNNTYDITLIVSFDKAQAQIGEKAHLKVGNLRFTVFGDISDDNAVDQRTVIDGVWEFELKIDNKFVDVTELQYTAVNADELANLGIVIESVTVMPSVCRIEASIDFDRAGLADPDNINKTDSPRLLGKLDWLDSHIHAVSGSDVYSGMTSDYTEVNGRVVKCCYEIGSMFFDAPENLTLILEGYGGTVIEIPLILN